MTLAPVQEPIVITQYQVLLDDIEQAKKQQITAFAYETKEMDREDVAAAIANGCLHPALQINWEAVA